MEREEEIRKDGWIKQNTIDEPRLSELVEIYESLGFEVRLEPVTEDEMKCLKCFKAHLDRYKTIYTKPKKGVNVSNS